MRDKLRKELKDTLDVQTRQNKEMATLQFMESKMPVKTSMGPEETAVVSTFKDEINMLRAIK